MSELSVIRLKRHINEEPLDAFVLNCKRRKTENATHRSSPNETSTILKFAGTINENTDISEHISKLTKDEAKDIIMKKRNPEKNLKQRVEENREKSQNNRFKIVNYTRALETKDENDENKKLTIVDVEKEQIQEQPSTSNASTSYTAITETPEDPYVYDLYVSENHNTVLSYPEDIDDLRVMDYDDYMYFCPRGTLVHDKDDDSDAADDDEDSNDENNMNNDYPDEEDDDDSVNESDMRRCVDNLHFGEDLSSEDENGYDSNSRNGFTYSVDSEAIGFEDDLDYCNTNRYGEYYARFRARCERDLKRRDSYDFSDDDDDDDDDYYDRYNSTDTRDQYEHYTDYMSGERSD